MRLLNVLRWGGLKPTQEKKKNLNPTGLGLTPLTPRHFHRCGGLCAHTRKKKDLNPTAFSPLGGGLRAHTRKKKRFKPHGIFAAGGGLVPTQEKKKILRKLSEFRRMIARCPVPLTK